MKVVTVVGRNQIEMFHCKKVMIHLYCFKALSRDWRKRRFLNFLIIEMKTVTSADRASSMIKTASCIIRSEM